MSSIFISVNGTDSLSLPMNMMLWQQIDSFFNQRWVGMVQLLNENDSIWTTDLRFKESTEKLQQAAVRPHLYVKMQSSDQH